MNDEDVGPFLAILFAILLVLVGCSYALHACNTIENATLGAADQEVARRNFEHSQAYREGLRRDFDELKLAYAKAKSDDERETILSVMRHRAAGAPAEAVPSDITDFIRSKQ